MNIDEDQPPDMMGSIVHKAADELSAHFDSVLILTTRQEEGTTKACWSIRGNTYASLALAQRWIDTEKRLQQQEDEDEDDQ